MYQHCLLYLYFPLSSHMAIEWSVFKSQAFDQTASSSVLALLVESFLDFQFLQASIALDCSSAAALIVPFAQVFLFPDLYSSIILQ